MEKNNEAGATEWVDPDDAPEITEDFFEQAKVFHGDTFVRRGRGRPKADVTKEQISVRLDPDVLAKLRQAGRGWQSQINALLRDALGMPKPTGAEETPQQWISPGRVAERYRSTDTKTERGSAKSR
jgi:uncharacterized protein (DUF4415 family)